MKASLRLAMVAVLIGLSGAGALGETAEGDRLIKDCGVNSLYLLLRLCSTNADLAKLRATMPDTRANGLSMAEIQAASAKHGVVLQGKRIGLGDVPIDRPMITLLRSDGDQGHFVVLEPVGVLGKSVMVLDFPRPAQVVAYSDLLKASGWTGLTLAPVTSWERFGPWSASGVGVLLLVLGLTSPWTRFKKGRRNPAGVIAEPA